MTLTREDYAAAMVVIEQHTNVMRVFEQRLKTVDAEYGPKTGDDVRKFVEAWRTWDFAKAVEILPEIREHLPWLDFAIKRKDSIIQFGIQQGLVTT